MPQLVPGIKEGDEVFISIKSGKGFFFPQEVSANEQ